MQTYSIKRTHDIELIEKLNKLLFPLDELETEFCHFCWVLYYNGKPVGFATSCLRDNGKRVFLSRAGVLPQHSGRGLQKRLIKARLAHAKKIGIKRCTTYVKMENIASQKNLLRCGFMPYWPRKKFICNTFVYFEKILN
jgi:GNAT superfamily N-acetyltransferase